MNKKQNISYSSQLLIATVVMSSFFMVNCNKGQNRAGVKATTVAGKAKSASGDATGASGDSSKMSGDSTTTSGDNSGVSSGDVSVVSLSDCSETISKSYVDLGKEYQRVDGLVKQNKTAQPEKKLKDEYSKVLLKCDDLGKVFDKAELKACKKTSASKNLVYKIVKAPQQCLNMAILLNKEDGTESDYLKLAQDQALILKKKEEDKKSTDTEAFKKVKLLISEDMKAMLKPTNLDFKSCIVEGVIKTDSEKCIADIKSKKTVCSFVKTSTEVALKDKVFLSVAEYMESEKKDMPVEFNGLGMAMSVSSEKAEDASGTFQSLSCANLSATKINLTEFKKAVGAHLAAEKTEPAKAEPAKTAAAK